MRGHIRTRRWPLSRSAVLGAAILLTSACTPAAAPTVAPAKPTEAAKPAPTAPAKPTEPALAKPTSAAQAKPAYDEKTIGDFYRGKTMRIVVGSAAGGGNDAISRLLARHMGKHVPGNPTFVVENMPGAATMVAFNHVANAAPKDGTSIAMGIGDLALQQLFGAQGMQFDMRRLNYLGVSSPGTYVGLVHKRTGITTFQELLGPNGKQLVVGATAPGATPHDAPAMLKDLLGANFKVVTGYAGLAPTHLAIENGEVDGLFNSWDSLMSTHGEFVVNGTYVPIIQLSTEKLRDPLLANVPSINDVTQDEEARRIIRLGVATNEFLRLFMVAAEVPPDRVAALQDAFMKTMQDPETLEGAAKIKLDIAPISGPKVKEQIVEFLEMPASTKARLEKIMKPS